MAVINARDCEFYYTTRGEGPAILMIMGWQANTDWWPEALLKHLEKKHQLFLFDNRGAGRSKSTKQNRSVLGYAKDALALMDAFKLKTAHVFGVSFGGMIAQELTLLAPDRVDKLILGCTTSKANIPISSGLIKTIGQFASTKMNSDQFMLSLLFSGEVTTTEAKSFVQRQKLKPISSKAKYEQLIAIARFNTKKRLADIKQNTLIITGSNDLMISPKSSKFLAEKIPNSKLKIFENLGHAFLGQDPILISKTINEFLD